MIQIVPYNIKDNKYAKMIKSMAYIENKRSEQSRKNRISF